MMKIKLVCEECNTVNEKDAKYCKQCGVSRDVELPQVDTEMSENWSSRVILGWRDIGRCDKCSAMLSADGRCGLCTKYRNTHD